MGWKCEGGNSEEKDQCTEKTITQLSETEEKGGDFMEIKMVGMSHLYGKIILNVKINYIPE